MQQARDQFLSSFMQTRKGTFVQKYNVKVVPEDLGIGSSKGGEKKQVLDGSAQPTNKGVTDGSPGNQGDDPQGVHGVQGDGVHGVQGDRTQGPQGGNLNQNDNAFQDFFNNFQDRVDYAVYNALINQSGVLANTLSNMMKSGTPVALLAQSTASTSAPAPAAPSSALDQLINPQLLVREQSQHPGPNVTQLTQDQVASMFLPPQNAINSAQQQPIQQTPSRQQVVQPIQQGSPIQQALQPVQQTPPRRPALQPIQQITLRQQGFQVNSAKIINKYQRKYDKQQEKHYEEHDDGFDPHWGCEFFRFCWNEEMRLPSIENCPGCSDIIESPSQSYNRSNRLRQERVSVPQRLGPVNQGRGQEDNVVRTNQWCPSGIFTKNQKRRVQRLRNRERL
ncbi:Os11g0424700 [Oryza sativa Japonica Group]|uniref:Os11g0424700 protein n=1 Tax=Oryza sativa subsp. japonica TaxID=39947 RepID=Q0IT29_ORYSJ|nr:Os11g0424700 [Oryza sativa Japonica Group]|eukprot:NP_001067773.2 Os11g0424700 [Oryza sativa Japonica Group]